MPSLAVAERNPETLAELAASADASLNRIEYHILRNQGYVAPQSEYVPELTGAEATYLGCLDQANFEEHQELLTAPLDNDNIRALQRLALRASTDALRMGWSTE